MESSKEYVKKVEEVNEESVYDILHEVEERGREIERARWENSIYLTVKGIEEFNENKKEVLKRILSFIAATTVFIGATKGYIALSKKVLDNNKFQNVNYVTLAYNEESGYSKDEEWVAMREAKVGTYIKIYEPWNMKSEREVKTYDISSLSDMELEEYLKLNLEEMGIDYTSTMENLSASDVLLNQEEVREVVKNIVYSDQTITNALPLLVVCLIYFVLVLALGYADDKISNGESYLFVLGNLNCLGHNINNLKYNKKQLDYKCNRDMLENICRITDMIKENKELRNRFVEEFNKLKCSDPSEIMMRFKRVCDRYDLDQFEKENSLILKEIKKRGINGK